MRPARAVLLAATLLALPRALPAQDARIRQLRDYLAAAAALGHVQGSVLVAESSRVFIDTAFGFANIELGVRNTPDTRFRVASVSKQFTAMAVAMLAVDGKLRIGDPISKYLDSLPAAWSGITIHHLLRHTSGISDYEEWFGGYTTQAYSDYMSQDSAAFRIARDARKRPLDFEPGTKFHYSNSAYILLGFVIERASGMPYEDYLRTRILEPLGMTRSGQDRSADLLADRASGYQLRPEVLPAAYFNGLSRGDYRNAVYQLMQPPQADAGLLTTARDLYRWDQALYTGRLVPRAMLDSIFTPGLGRYGYGWFVMDGPDGVTYGHSGGLPGFTCYILRIPRAHRTIILLGNLDRTGRTVRDLAAIMRGERIALPRARALVAVDSARNARHAGVYRTDAGDSVTVSLDGAVLVGHWRERWRTPFYEERDGSYYLPSPDATARFRERGGRAELVVEDAFGRTLVRGVRAPRPAAARDYLYLWTASADSAEPDFLAVLDVTDDAGEGGRYGRIVTTVPTPGRGNVPHHTEHEMPADRQLFANGFGSGRSWIFDLRDPAAPRIAGEFADLAGFSHPHSFLRLPSGNVLATFQMRHGADGTRPGGLVEITPDGRVVRSASAEAAGLDPATRVYSGGIVPALDRIVTTTTDMAGRSDASRQLQIWRLSDLSLLHTIVVPDGPAGGESQLTAEPRVLADGRTVLVSTFSCGLYLMEGLDTGRPSARLVASFPRKARTNCAIPVIAGKYYLVTVPAWSAVVSLDISDPAAPREVSRLTLGPDDVPHWIAISPDHRRVVVTGYAGMRNRVVLALFDPATGALSLDERFGEPGSAGPGFSMAGRTWPHGGSADGVPHGAVFSRP